MCIRDSPDVKVLPLGGDCGHTKTRAQTRRSVLDALMDRSPGGVFLAGCVPGPGAVELGDANGGEPPYMTLPFGLTMRVVRRDAPEAEQRWRERDQWAWRTVLHRVSERMKWQKVV